MIPTDGVKKNSLTNSLLFNLGGESRRGRFGGRGQEEDEGSLSQLRWRQGGGWCDPVSHPFLLFLVCVHDTCKNRLLIFSVVLFGFLEYLILAYLLNNKGFGFG